MSSFPPDAATNPDLPHDSLGPQVIGICSAMLVLVTLAVAARFWIRLKLVKGGLGADDWLILVAWVLAVAFDLDPLNQTRFGLGQHIYDLSPNTDFSASLELYYFGEILYYVCVAVTKVAILILYLRLAVQRTYRTLIWVCIIFVTTTSLACVLASIFQCQPIHKAWNAKGAIPGHCFDVNALFFANAALDIFQDILIYILPMRMLYQIQIPRRQKIALMMIFAVGGFVVVTGMVRLNSLKDAQNTPDPSYDNFGAAVWSSIECNVGIVCASLPHFKPLIDRFFPNLMGRSQTDPRRNLAKGSSGLTGKRGDMRDEGLTEIELEHGTSWRSTYDGKHQFGKHGTSVRGGDTVPERTNNSQEQHLRNQSIYKSTSVSVIYEKKGEL